MQRATYYPRVPPSCILPGYWRASGRTRWLFNQGGTTQALESQERIRLRNVILAFRVFLEKTLFGVPLEQVNELQTDADLMTLNEQASESDFCRFLRVAADLDLHRLGNASDRFLSYGAYAFDNDHLFKPGTWTEELQALDTQGITEDLSHSWMTSHQEPRHPFQGSTIPATEFDDDDGRYSWCKAPRLNGAVYEVGALARQVIDGHPLIRELVAANGGNVRSRVIARLLELARIVPQMEAWADQLTPDDAYCLQAEMPDEAEGIGLAEAARGSLGHWLQIKRGKIINYQIIAPTTWNFSPRDAAGNPGALELALQGTAVNGDQHTSPAIQHIIRSFDPCMVCTVH